MSSQPQQPEQQPPAAIVKAGPREVRVVQDTGPLANLFDTARFEHLQRIATLMAGASLIPDHLKGGTPAVTMANCFLIVNAAVRFGFDPFQFAPETYFLKGKLAYQGKLVAAIVNARAGLKGRLDYTFSGKGDDLTVFVSGTFEGEDKPRQLPTRLGDVKTDNKMWKDDPQQKLVYTGSIRWARRFCPDIILGCITHEEAEQMRDDEGRRDLSGQAGDFVDVTPEPLRDAAQAGEQGSAPAASSEAEIQDDDLSEHLTVPYGKDKGKTPAELDDANLKLQLSAAKKALDSPKLIGDEVKHAEGWFAALVAEAVKRGITV